MSRASFPRARRSASRTAGRTRGSSSRSIAWRIATLISSPVAPRAEASAARTHHTGSGSKPDSTRAKSPRSVRARAPRAAARIHGSRSPTRPTRRGPERRVRREDGEGAQRLAPHHVARGGEERRRGRRSPRASPIAAEGAQRLERHGLVGVPGERQQELDRGGVLERPEAAGGEGARAGVGGGDGGDEDRPQLRALEAHRHPRRRPPVEARPLAVEEGAPRGGRVLQPSEGEEGEALLRPGVLRAPGVVAAHGHAADRLRQRVHHEARDRGRRARVADPAEGLRRPAPHPAVGVGEGGEEPVDGGRAPTRPSAKAAIRRTSTSWSFRRSARAGTSAGSARRPAASAARRRTPRSGSRRSASSSPAPPERESSSASIRASFSMRGGGGEPRASSPRARPARRTDEERGGEHPRAENLRTMRRL